MRKTGLKSIYLDYDGVIVNTVETIGFIVQRRLQILQKIQICAVVSSIHMEFSQNAIVPARNTSIPILILLESFIDYSLWNHAQRISVYKLREVYNVKIVSMGKHANLKLKEEWIERNLSWCRVCRP